MLHSYYYILFTSLEKKLIIVHALPIHVIMEPAAKVLLELNVTVHLVMRVFTVIKVKFL